MMVDIAKFKRGLANYVDREIISRMPYGTIKKVAIGTAMSLYISNVEKLITGAKTNAFVSALGVIGDNGDIDVERLAAALRDNIPEEGEKISVDMFGMHLADMTFHKTDVDALKDCILSA